MKTVFGAKMVAALVCAAGIAFVTGCASQRSDRTLGQYIDDRALANRVEEALEDQRIYKFPDIEVHAYRGVVQLSGFALSEEQIRAAAKIAAEVQGVSEVKNSIQLAPDSDRTYVRDPKDKADIDRE